MPRAWTESLLRKFADPYSGRPAGCGQVRIAMVGDRAINAFATTGNCRRSHQTCGYIQICGSDQTCGFDQVCGSDQTAASVQASAPIRTCTSVQTSAPIRTCASVQTSASDRTCAPIQTCASVQASTSAIPAYRQTGAAAREDCR